MLITANTKGKLAIKGTSTLIGGKGRYVGAKGDATWEGEQNQAGATAAQPGEAIAYFDGVVNIKSERGIMYRILMCAAAGTLCVASLIPTSAFAAQEDAGIDDIGRPRPRPPTP